MKERLVAIVCCSLFVPACLGEIGTVDEPWLDDGPLVEGTYAPDSVRVEVLSSRLEGQLGSVVAGDEQYVYSAFTSRSRSEFDLRARGESGVIMNSIWLSNVDAFELGRTYGFQRDAHPEADGGAFAAVISCSGPDDDEWENDVPADSVEVTVSEGPDEGTLDVFFEATYASTGPTRGHLVFRR